MQAYLGPEEGGRDTGRPGWQGPEKAGEAGHGQTHTE